MSLTNQPIIEIEDLSVHFEAYDELGLQRRKVIKAVDGVSASIQRGEILCVVGESGSGKTTLARAIVGLAKPISGRLVVDGKQVDFRRRRDLRELWKTTQMIFQDPYSTFNPLSSVFDALATPLRKFGLVRDDYDVRQRVERVLNHVGLKLSELEGKYPSQLSGGERQRAAIARALLVDPKVIIADEPVSMLDVSLRAGILDLLKVRRDQFGATIVFITHDLAVAQYLGDRIAVMYRGKIVELASSKELIGSPLHPYTELLLKSTPRLKGEQSWSEKQDISLRGVDAGKFTGCRFYSRCPIGTEVCVPEHPELKKAKDEHFVACYLRA